MNQELDYTLNEINRKLDYLMNLDKSKSMCSSEMEDKMPQNESKIRRHIKVHDVMIWISADTEQEYADKLIRLAFGKAELRPADKHNFELYSNRWFEVYSRPNVANVTAVNYRRQLDLHILPKLGQKNIEDIVPSDIQLIFNALGADAKQETKNKIKQILNQIFRTAMEELLIPRNPMDSTALKIRGEASSETEPYSVEQMQYLAEHLDDVYNPMERAWLALSITLPLRPEEVLGLRWGDVDEQEGTIRIHGTVTHPTRNEPEYKTYPKTTSSRRTLVVPREVLDILPDRGADDEFVIGGKYPISYTKLRGMRKRIAIATHFDEAIIPRRFRTTVATDISAQTHDLKLVQRMLGHATPEMTLKHYDKGRNTSVDAVDAVTKVYGIRRN